MEPKRSYLPWAVGGVVIVFIIIIVILTTVGINLIISSRQNRPAPLPTAPEVPEITPPAPPKTSKLASDSGLLNLKVDLLKLGAQIDSVDLVEPQLSPPSLDLSISIRL